MVVITDRHLAQSSTTVQYSVMTELTTFGIEQDFEFTGHLSLATHLVPMPKKTFATSDDTQIRIWGRSGDIAKMTFPKNKRSMVSAMTFCPSHSLLVSAEIDMTFKVYATNTLDLLDTFKAEQKIAALAYYGPKDWLLAGGDAGLEVWKLIKSPKRRIVVVGRYEHHFQLTDFRKLHTAGNILGINSEPAEERFVVWASSALYIFDTSLTLLCACQKPHSEPIRCAALQILSIIDTAVITGGQDCLVNFWNISSKQVNKDRSDSLDDEAEVSPYASMNAVNRNEKKSSISSEQQQFQHASMRLEHSFKGHQKPVLMVCFYKRLERDKPQKLCVSCGLDDKMKVWSLDAFSLVYTLDLHLLESKATIFPIAPNNFAVSSFSDEEGRSRSTVALVHFTAHVAAPFVTTNQSPVVLLSRPTPSITLQKQVVEKGDFACMTAVASEDMAVRLVDAQALRVVATLPPPPNSQVQVLRVMICSQWRLLILWLSSMEIAIFFVPPSTSRLAPLNSKAKEPASPRSGRSQSSRNSQAGQPGSPQSPRRSGKRVTATGASAPGAGGSTQGGMTPILVRRFGILEVTAHSLDKELMRETFNCMALHHGRPLPRKDVKEPSSFSKPVSDEEASAEAWLPDWFLCVGTKLGTMQAFRLKEVLESSPTWPRLAETLPQGFWTPRRRRANDSEENDAEDSQQSESGPGPFDEEQRAALNALRVPGQRPYPVDAPSLLLYGRWVCHDYQVEVLETCGARLLTIDMRKSLKLWQIRNMQCVFEYRLEDFLCQTPYFEAVAPDGDNAPPDVADEGGPVPELRGVCTGESSGQLRLLVTSAGRAVPSTASHTDAVQQIDFIWPHNAFVSIGADCTVKLWSRSLTLLRDIAFPQPLTSVGFKQRPDFDSSQGHGDVIVGFAKHAEMISVDFWTRDIPRELLGKASRRSSALDDNVAPLIKKHTGFTNAIAEGSEEIEDHVIWLHAEDPLATKARLESQRGVGLKGAAFVSKFAEKVLEHKAAESILDPEKRAKKAAEEEAKVQCGMRLKLLKEEGIVFDFRGRPLVTIGELGGAPAQQSSIDASQWSSKEPTVSHERASCLDEGEIADVSHIQPGYYDKFVEPTTVVDCPRGKTIRGQVDMQGIAHVTSVGTDYLRGSIDDAPEEEQTQKAVPESKRAKKESERATTPGRHSSRKDRPSMVAPSTPHIYTKVERVIEPGEEPWRNIRRGRAVPGTENEAKPRTQEIARDPEKATAMMLTHREDIAEVPDVPAENFLKNLTTVKKEWLYTQPGSSLLQGKQREIERVLSLRDSTQKWTQAGRLVTAEEPIPMLNLEKHSMFQPPPVKPPETRGEVTERVLIEKAKKPPTPTPQFALCGDEPWQPKTGNHGVLRRPPKPGTERSRRSEVLRSDPRSGGVIRSAR